MECPVHHVLTFEHPDIRFEVYIVPSLPRAVPTWYTTAAEPLKSVSVAGSASNPASVSCENGRVTAGSPGGKT